MTIKSKCLLYSFSVNSKTRWVFPHPVWPANIANNHKHEWVYDDTYFSFWMHKTICFKRAETYVYRRFLPRPGHWYQDLRCVGRSFSHWPNEGCCITRCTFSLTHVIPRARDKLKRPTQKSFPVFLFDDTEEKVEVRFEGEKGQDAIYKITLCKYLNPDNKFPIDQSIRFLCVAHPV